MHGASRDRGISTEDLRLEKMLEVIYEHANGSLAMGCRKDCPLLRFLNDMLVEFKSANNEKVSAEFGLTGDAGWRCPCEHQDR